MSQIQTFKLFFCNVIKLYSFKNECVFNLKWSYNARLHCSFLGIDLPMAQVSNYFINTIRWIRTI